MRVTLWINWGDFNHNAILPGDSMGIQTSEFDISASKKIQYSGNEFWWPCFEIIVATYPYINSVWNIFLKVVRVFMCSCGSFESIWRWQTICSHEVWDEFWLRKWEAFTFLKMFIFTWFNYWILTSIIFFFCKALFIFRKIHLKT